MVLTALIKFAPIRPPNLADRQALIMAAKQQLQFYRAGLPLLEGETGKAIEIPLNYKIWGLQYGQQSTQVLQSYGAIADYFHSGGVGGRLLLLGEPGMGKTHTLLAVGELLLHQASRNQAPVPILVDLSAWSGDTLRNWLIDYFWQHYRIAKTVAEVWIDTGQLTLLLDGFDHLPSGQQRTCAQAIDALLRTNPNQAALLCCRRKVLEESGIAFGEFNSGVNIVPLMAQQVKDYVMAFALPEVWQGIKSSKTLQQLARCPLLLSMLVTTGTTTKDNGQPITNRSSLVDHYLTHQLAQGGHRGDRAALGWLAQQLATRSRLFYLDDLCHLWLPESTRLLYRLLLGLALALTFGLVGGNVVLGLALGLVASQVDLESLPRLRFSLATASFARLSSLALVSTLGAGILGLGLASLSATLLSPLNLGTQAFAGGGLVGAIAGWGLGLSSLMWGGLHNTIQVRRSPNQDVQMAFRNSLVLVALLGLVIVLLAVLPAIANNQSPLTVLSPSRGRLLLASLVGAVVWLSFGLQQALVRLLLASRWPLTSQPVLHRLVKLKLLRRVGGGYGFCHDLLREALAQPQNQKSGRSPSPVSRP
ncbi:NACHT domain-containing protein [Nodosilinea sp. P-1105]|uniref:NACHT domain-containing protein n=1 Tax=Nodosilinea sp. P-1105 TaxID=2546229 RepID=UPI00146A5405|nr:NACHT domain-containing protein [Nodosilinea sp. P-1105]NMF81784.1 NACHT domain-containing protein [Nodosilinea sp. P-1105]